MFTTALTVFSVVAVSYASTSLDNLVLLVGWLLSGSMSRSSIFAGYILGMLAVLAIAFGLGLVSYLMPVQYLGYLGVIPILLGLKMLVELRRDTAADREAIDASRHVATGAAIAAVALTQLSNGVDTVLVFAPLLADSRMDVDLMIIGSFVLMVVGWCGLANGLTLHAKRVQSLTSTGRWLAPVVMIAVGIYILSNTATDMV